MSNNDVEILKLPEYSWHTVFSVGAIALLVSILLGCSSCSWNLDVVDYSPVPGGDWAVSTPADQGLDPKLLEKTYFDASKLETLYSLLVIKNGYLIAEGYFNEGSIDQVSGRQSTTKSITSALTGIALDQGYLTSVDQNMMEFFPEFADQITDPRKNDITIRHLLQMRAGFPDEEKEPYYQDVLFFIGNYRWVPHLVNFPLVNDPGTAFDYSNQTSHLLGVIITRATGTNLKSFAQDNLYTPMNAEIVKWSVDDDGYTMGAIESYVTARDMAKFGLLYLDDGGYNGTQIVPAQWVEDSLAKHTENIIRGGWTRSRYGDFFDIGYGYQWWSGRVGDHSFDYACGHGGQYIILLHDLNMIIVSTADPLYGLETASSGGWKYEGAINKVVARFIKSLPSE